MRMTEEKGYFLLETVLLGAILISTLSVFMAAASAHRLCERSKSETAAAFLAQEIMSGVEAEGRGRQLAGQPALHRNVTRSGQDYQTEAEFRTVSESSRLCRVVLHVSWQEAGSERVFSCQRMVLCHD